jgi:hypothetical protein
MGLDSFMKLGSREYKVIIDADVMKKPATGLARIVADLAGAGLRAGIVVRDEFDSAVPRQRLVRFLDTPDRALQANDLLLRQRIRLRDGATEYTLKCRSEDHFIAMTTDVRARKRFKPEDKLEEDICAPFVSRLSHSTTVEAPGKLAGDRFPRTLEAAGGIFPALREIALARRVAPARIGLRPVSEPPVFEQVYTGPLLRMPPGGGKIGPVAAIVWSRGPKGKVLTAELSFRHEKPKAERMSEIAPAAKRFFEEIQRLQWVRPDGPTKTRIMYRQAQT